MNVMIYKVSSIAADGAADSYSLSPAAVAGYNDDGGRVYALPDGYTIDQSRDGERHVYHGDTHATIVPDNAGTPMLVTSQRVGPTLSLIPRPTIGERIFAARKSAGVSQAELSRRTGLSQAAISDIERGVRADVMVATAAKIADALGITPGELMGD